MDILKNIIIIILLSIGTVISLDLFYYNKNLLPYASMEIINKTKIDIKEILIKHTNGEISYTNLEKNKKIVYPIYLKGEGSYLMEVIFFDHKVKSLETVGYIESGYKLKYIIQKNKIIEQQVLRILP